MFTDFVLNGSANGEVAQELRGVGYDAGLMRPWRDSKDRACVDVKTGRMVPRKDPRGGGFITNSMGMPKLFPEIKTQTIAQRMHAGLQVPVLNATILRKDEWILLDQQVLEAAQDRLKAWADLRAANTYGGFDGMANPILEFERMTDNGEAVVDMDGMTEARNFQPTFDLQGMPLPITHADFFLSARFLAASKNKGMPADGVRQAAAGRRIGETIERTCIGTQTGTVYGDSTRYGAQAQVYGYLTHPDRLTKTNMTAPNGSNGTTVLTDWLACRELLFAQKFYGPFMVYTSTDYDQYLDNLFSTTEPSAGTLRNRLLEIEDIQGIQRLDYLDAATYPFTTIWVEMKPETARAVNGMEITTVQWPSMGGMRLNFKVLCIQVPQIRSRFVGPNTTTAKCGILQATTA